jgi:hypothetical protein
MRSLLLSALLLAVTGSSAEAQSFAECADVSGDTAVNVIDMVHTIDVYRGYQDLPAGKGDIDGRDGYNLGDFRYLIGWLFIGYPDGTCGTPHSSSVLPTTNDTLYLPTVNIPPGTGTVNVPVVLASQTEITDVLVPFQVSGMGPGIFLDSVSVHLNNPPTQITADEVTDSTGMFLISYIQGSLPSGRHILATAHFRYEATPGATVFFSDAVPNEWTFLNYVYGDPSTHNHSDLNVGVPTVRMTSGIDFPAMVVTPDTLFFDQVTGDPNPDPQYIYINSDGVDFQWNATVPFNYSHTGASGASGDSLGLYPRSTSMAIGTYDYQVEIYSSSVSNSPLTVHLHLEVRPPFPAFDANCDGLFTLADVVVLVNYLFRGGDEPCNPNVGGP